MTTISEREALEKLTDEAIVEYLLTRLRLFYMYHFGSMTRDRREARSKGDVNWRVVRYKRVVHPQSAMYPVDRLSYVTPTTLAKHAKYLANNCNVVTIDELVRKLSSGEPIEDDTVAITFDCAYRDVYQNAIPILVKYNLPATVFVPTAYPDTNNMFWMDKVTGALMTLKLHGYEYPYFPVFNDVFKSDLLELGDLGEINMAKIALTIQGLRDLPSTERMNCLISLGAMVESLGGIPSEELFMTWDELRSLKNLNVNVGSMGHGHKMYSEESSAEEIAKDIHMSYAILQEQQVPLSRIFSVPFGDVSKAVRGVLGEMGIIYCLGIGSFTRPRPKKNFAAVIPRVPMYEALSHCKEMFAARLWTRHYLSG